MKKSRYVYLHVLYEGAQHDLKGRYDSNMMVITNSEQHLRSTEKLIMWWRECGFAVSILLVRSDNKVLYEWKKPGADYPTPDTSVTWEYESNDNEDDKPIKEAVEW